MDDKTLIRSSQIDPKGTSKGLQRELVSAGIHVHSSTVRRRLLEVGRIARRPQKKPLLTARMKKTRLQWAKKYRSWTKEDWRRVIFSDETHFEVHGVRSTVVKRSKGETFGMVTCNRPQNTPLRRCSGVLLQSRVLEGWS